MAPPDAPTLGLYLVLLLLLWLLTRVRERDRRVRRRRSPVTPNELGRMLLEVAHGGDLDEYRGLYLSGGEVRQVLGEEGQRYLDGRSIARLSAALQHLHATFPAGAIFQSMRVAPDGTGTVELRLRDGTTRAVMVGTVVQVGVVWRLRDPPTG